MFGAMARRKREDNRAAVAAPVSRRGFALPLALTLGLLLLARVPRVHENPVLFRSFWGAALALLVWQLALYFAARRSGEGRSFQVLLRPQHYVQALAQATVYAYWGYYFRPVHEFVPLLAGQILFAYVFDTLLSWSRRESHILGFGPFPILFSTNFFLWFRDDWFYLQFLLVAVGFLGKEFLRWHRDGRSTHIFNPSAFSLGVFSLVLIATNASDLTRGREIAATLGLGPRIYLLLFLVGLVAMYRFGITLVTGCAAATLFGLSALYWRMTGVPYFLDSEIPTAVFLGLHLLVTDPSTSPRTPLGKGIFGTLYGLGVFGLYALLRSMGAPTFYDKLLCVPLLNLCVKRIDGLARAVECWPREGFWAFGNLAAADNRVYMTVWILFFGAMTTLGSTDGPHPGDRLPFWQQACAEGRRNACERLVEIESSYCGDNSAWACNELGASYREGRVVQADPELAWKFFSRACELRNAGACFNLLDASRSTRTNPKLLDLRLLLREGGPNLMEMPERDLLARACAHGFTFACAREARR
jgi:hypothetical protein